MKIDIEFAYPVEISAPSVRRPGHHNLPKLHWLFGRETVEFREIGPEEFPIALRRQYGGERRDHIERTDGAQLFCESRPGVEELRSRWSTAYSRNDGPWLLRRWLGDGVTATCDWCPSFEEDFPDTPEGSLVWSGREDSRMQLHKTVANHVVHDGEFWQGRGLPIVAVLSPGSSRPGSGPAATVGLPRVVDLSDIYGADRGYLAELAARDLLFYPEEMQQAHDRAREFRKRIIGLEREPVFGKLPRYPDFSALSMASWAKLMVKHLVLDEMPDEPVMALPGREDGYTYMLLEPAELAEPIDRLLKLFEARSPRRELMSAFSAVKAAFGATVETAGLARRRNIAELLELHGRILRRAEMRPHLRLEDTLAPIDEDSLIALLDDSGSSMPAP